MNIWHDMSPERIKEEDFTVIEISKGSKKSMNWIRKQD